MTSVRVVTDPVKPRVHTKQGKLTLLGYRRGEDQCLVDGRELLVRCDCGSQYAMALGAWARGDQACGTCNRKQRSHKVLHDRIAALEAEVAELRASLGRLPSSRRR